MERRGVVRPGEREAVDRGVVPPPGAGPEEPSWEWATRAWSSVAGDLTLHGISYLGVLFVLAGVLGLVLFAFAADQPSLRPVAELVVPLALFGSASFLRRVRAGAGATVVGLLGGVLTAVAAFASLADEAAFPPDPRTDQARYLAWAGTALALAVAYGLSGVAGRRRDGGHQGGVRPGGAAVRWLAGPLAWTAVGAAGLGLDAGPSALQMAVVAVAILLTTIVAMLSPEHPLALPTVVAAGPCLGVTFLLTIALAGDGAAGGHGWAAPPAGEPLVAGIATLVAAELIGRRLRRQRAATLAQAITLVVLGAALLPGAAAAWYGALAVPVFFGLIEWQLLHHRDQPVRPAVLVSLAGAGAGLFLASARPWSAVVAWAAASVWLHARRLWHPDGEQAAGNGNGGPNAQRDGAEPAEGAPAAGTGIEPSTLALWAAAAPIGAVIGLVLALPAGWALVAVGAALAALAVAVHARVPNDRFYATWLPLAAAGVGAGTMLAPGPRGQPAVAAALVTVALALAPRHPVLRVAGRARQGRAARRWPLPLLEVAATVTGVWAVVLGAQVVRLPLPAVAGVIAAGAVAAAILARLRGRPALRPVAALLAFGAAGCALAATDPTATRAGLVALAAGALLAAATVTLWLRRPAALWLQALVVAGGAAAVAGLALSAGLALGAELAAAPGPPVRWQPPLAAALVVAALQAAVAGLVARQVAALAAAPMLALGAWVTFALDRGVGGWQWYAIPAGAALLAALEAVRHGRRRAGARLDRWWLRVPEAAGVLLTVGPSLVLAVIGGPVNGLLAALLGGALLTWGLATRVRRRAAAGAIGAVLGIVLMLLVPLGRSLPSGGQDGPVLWLLLAAAGLALLFAASSLEHGRGRLTDAFRRLDRALDGWE